MKIPANLTRPSALALCLLLAACASSPKAPSDQQIAAAQQEAQALAARGYPSPLDAATEQFVEVWQGPQGAVMANVILPREVPTAPVVLYLPGPGGPADEGERWRRAWARAGYAVISLQSSAMPRPLPGRNGNNAPVGAQDRTAAAAADPASAARDDVPPTTARTAAHASRPDEDRPPGDSAPGGAAGDRGAVQAAGAVQARWALAGFALEELARRQREHGGPYARMDGTRIAVVGFDLGADTALALAGAHTRRDDDQASLVAPTAVRTVIALGPYVDTARANPARVYGPISLPVLTVTGTADADRAGLVDDPHARLAPFTFMPAGGKGLLVLAGGLHDTLAGSLQPRHPGATDEAPERGQGRRSGDSGRNGPPSGGGMGGGGMGGGGPGGGMGGSGAGGPAKGGRGMRDGDDAGPAIEPYAQYVIVEQVTTAWLDARLKDDPIAAEWLARNTARWLGARGDWRMK